MGGGEIFDYERFYIWASTQSQPVFISEYDMPADLFEPIWETEKNCSYSSKNKSKRTVERLFIPKGQAERGLTTKQLSLDL